MPPIPRFIGGAGRRPKPGAGGACGFILMWLIGGANTGAPGAAEVAAAVVETAFW